MVSGGGDAIFFFLNYQSMYFFSDEFKPLFEFCCTKDKIQIIEKETLVRREFVFEICLNIFFIFFYFFCFFFSKNE